MRRARLTPLQLALMGKGPARRLDRPMTKPECEAFADARDADRDPWAALRRFRSPNKPGWLR